MKPYYEDARAGITIWHGDCREILPTLDPVDLVLTDPPYGINDRAKQTEKDRIGKRRGGSNFWHPASWWDNEINPTWGKAISSVSNKIAWFGHWRKRYEVESIITLPLRAEIVWAKDCHTGPPTPLAPRDERIWLFSENGIVGSTFETTVWDCAIIPTWEHRYHKNEKPLALILRLIRFLNPQTIIDPFMGSGTTLRAAKDLGRKAIGIEIEERYCEIAAKRLAQEVLPLEFK